MKRIFLHAGHYKTGTTSAQRAMASGRDRMAAEGLTYPEYGGYFPDRHNEKFGFSSPPHDDGLRNFWREQAALFRERPEDTIILSAESIASLSRENLQAFRALLPDFRITFVFALRHWAGFCPSLWRDQVRWGDGLTCREMLKRLQVDHDVSIAGDISLPLKRAAGIVDDIFLIPYSAAEMLPRLFAAFGMSQALSESLSARRERENASLTFVELEATRICNLILASRESREVDVSYRATIAPATIEFPAIDLAIIEAILGMPRAFLASGLPGADDLKALIADRRVELPKRDWAPLFTSWSDRLKASLDELALPPMPADWGQDEMDGAVSCTELAPGDIPDRIARSYLDFVDGARGAGG